MAHLNFRPPRHPWADTPDTRLRDVQSGAGLSGKGGAATHKVAAPQQLRQGKGKKDASSLRQLTSPPQTRWKDPPLRSF